MCLFAHTGQCLDQGMYALEVQRRRNKSQTRSREGNLLSWQKRSGRPREERREVRGRVMDECCALLWEAAGTREGWRGWWTGACH